MGSQPNATALQSQQRHDAAIFLNFFGCGSTCHCCQTLKAIQIKLGGHTALQKKRNRKNESKNHDNDAKMAVLAILCPVIFYLVPRILYNSLVAQRQNKHSLFCSPLQLQALLPVFSTDHFQQQWQESEAPLEEKQK